MTDSWYRKEMKSLDKLKRTLAKMLDNQKRKMVEHKKWMKSHKVNLNKPPMERNV